MYLYYRLDAVESNEELSDVDAHFKLYYGKDLVAMQNLGAAGDVDSLTTDKDLQNESDRSKVLSVKQAKRYVPVVLIKCSSETCNQTGCGCLMNAREFLL